MAVSSSSSHQNSVNFINDAFNGPNSVYLPYWIPAQKLIIQNHLISLLQDFPSFIPSVNFHTYPNYKTALILNVTAEFYVSPRAPPFVLAIWMHDSYPQTAPFVYLYPNSPYPTFPNGSVLCFLGLGLGRTTSTPICSYLQNWNFGESNSNLLDLMHNLLDLFFRNHPYIYAGFFGRNHPALLKMEEIDSVYRALCKGLVDFKSRADEEIKHLSARRAEMVKRSDSAKGQIIGLERKRENLKGKVKESNDESDKILKWLKIVKTVTENEYVEDEESIKAADFAIEDLICAMDKAVGEGVLSFEVYVKEVRVLAKEQFLHRAKIVAIDTERLEKTKDRPPEYWPHFFLFG